MSSIVSLHARAVVIGCGIVGNSLAYHLTGSAGRDVVLLDKGPLPNPGGSTGPRVELHLPRRPLQGDDRADARERAPVQGAGRLHRVRRHRGRAHRGADGGARGAGWRRPRRGASSRALLTPAEVKELVPFIDEPMILGGFYTPDVGVVDSLRAGTLMRERGAGAGALTVFANTEVLGIDVERRPRPAASRTTAGDIEAETW